MLTKTLSSSPRLNAWVYKYDLLSLHDRHTVLILSFDSDTILIPFQHICSRILCKHLEKEYGKSPYIKGYNLRIELKTLLQKV